MEILFYHKQFHFGWYLNSVRLSSLVIFVYEVADHTNNGQVKLSVYTLLHYKMHFKQYKNCYSQIQKRIEDDVLSSRIDN